MAKQGLMILGGVVDWDYRGEVGVIIHNSGPNEYIPLQGDRIAQLTIEPLAHPTSVKHTRWAHYDKWNTPTKRGEQGFGHSGRFIEAVAAPVDFTDDEDNDKAIREDIKTILHRDAEA